MGEYLNIKGDSVKIGTCENMYYSRFDQFVKAIREGATTYGTSPDSYTSFAGGCRFRFPFPDEDGTEIGNYSDYDRGLLIQIPRPMAPAGLGDGYDDATAQIVGQYNNPQRHSELSRLFVKVPNPNNTAPLISLEIIQQRPKDGKLLLVLQDPFTGNRFRIEETADIVQLCAALSETYLKGDPDSDSFKFWDEIIARIFAGYDLPYEKKGVTMTPAE